MHGQLARAASGSLPLSRLLSCRREGADGEIKINTKLGHAFMGRAWSRPVIFLFWLDLVHELGGKMGRAVFNRQYLSCCVI